MRNILFKATITTLAIAMAFMLAAPATTEAQSNAPVIHNFTPLSAPPGTLISIFGRNLGGAVAVRFNSANAQFRVVTSDFIQAVVPVNAGTGPISVTTRFGTARSGAFFTSTQQGGGVEIFTFSPAGARVGTRVTITGRNFATTGTRAVLFNGVRANFAVVSSNQIIALVPQGATTGPVRVEGATGIATSRGFFNVLR